MFKKIILVFVISLAMVACGGGGSSDGSDESAFAGTYPGTFSAIISGGDTITGTLSITVLADGTVIINFPDDAVLTGTIDTSNTAVIETAASQLLSAAACVIGTLRITLLFGTSTANTIIGSIAGIGVVVCGGMSVTISGTITIQ